ncbi:lantibiotic dehydratase C-terminal domain-containing protein [uncultured Arthrobacter sp.]|uniref:lantibiotic dehydratase C-terminal domain-containing protein n=1 Tax=uncultured Arthrobacter sp. TaxID=114050 RepID=UPI00260DC8CF|nr:lantibiotic dehydratase C-terminal domain-containing protein [uncultured Arthrobacter sp.]
MPESIKAFVGLQVTYYDDAKQELLATCLLPLVFQAQAMDGVNAAWIQSHWRLGPHSTLYIHGEAGVLAKLVPRLAGSISLFLDCHPSRRAIDPAQYEVLSKELGRLELTEPPYLPLEPDNSLRIIHEEPVDTFLRSRSAIELKGRIIGDGLRNVLTADHSILDGGHAFSSAFRGMAALAVSYPQWGLVSGYQAFLSHWKEYFYWADADGQLQRVLEGSFREQESDLSSVLQMASDLQPGELSGDPVLDGWLSWVRGSLPRAMELAATGDILPYPHPDRLTQARKFGDATAVQWSGSDDRNYSDFHRAFRKLDFTKLGNGTDFAAYRFLINNFFELLPVMGITPLQRYSLAYFFSTAAQLVVGETWETTVARSIERQQRASPDVRPTLPWVGSNA